MENGINSSWNPFHSNPQSPVNGDRDDINSIRENRTAQDYDVETVEEENSVLPNVTGQINVIHQTPPFSDFNVDSNPFAAPDWVGFPPPDFYKDKTPDVFQTTSASGIWGEETDIFQPFKEKVDTDVTQSSSTNQNTESSSSSNQRDPLLEFILSRQKKFQATPSFTSPSDPSDVFQETSTKTVSGYDYNHGSLREGTRHCVPKGALWERPFRDAVRVPSKGKDSFFETPYVSNTDPVFDDIFKTPSSTAGTSDIKAFDPLFDPQNEVQSNRNSNYDLLLTGQDTKQDVRMSHVGLQNGAVQEIASTNTSNGDLMFRRRPPKPAPRSKAAKSIHLPQNTTAEVEHDLPVYEDVLLIGQERCVEDWPEHSPELSPAWKPAGKFRLRRDSVRIAEASDGVDGIAKKNGKQTLGRKLRHSLLIRRSSKDKIGDEVKSSETNSDTLHRGSKLVIDSTEEFFALDEEQNEAGEKKSSKPKIISQRRGSKGKHAEASAKGFTPDYQDDLKSSSKTADLTALGEKRDEDVDCKPKQTQKFKPPVPHRPSKDASAVGLKSLPGPPPSMQSKSFSKDPFLEEDLDLGSSHHDRHQKIAEIETHPDDEGRNTEGINENADGQKQKKKVKVKFVPQRGFVIGLSKVDKANNETKEEIPHFKENDDAELKGACGFTPHPELKDHDGLDELKGMSSYTPQEFKEDTLQRTEAGRSYSPNNFKSSYSNGFMGPSSWDSKAADWEKDGCKAADLFTSSDFSEKHQEMQDCRPKKTGKFKIHLLHRRHSKNIEESEIRTTKDHDEMKKPPILKVPPLSRRDSKSVEEDEVPQKGADLFKARDAELAEDIGWEEYTPDNKPQKPKETDSDRRGSKDTFPEDFLDSLGATSGDFYLSDAAKAEWMSAQMDMRRLRDQEEERKHEEEEDEGDTDSLMEWWNTVEFWDELPSNETISSKEEETISFKAVADKVHRGLRVYLKLFMEQAELLYQHVLILYGIADDISNFHHRTKIANITGGTTTAVGGAAAIAGLALIPVTFGASIIVSAIGLGVATAGGITAASASISDNIHNMHDRKKIEIIIQDYEAQLVEMQRCLRFIIEGLCRLRTHPLLRRNNYYTGDWEVRRALQTISLVTDPVEQAEEITNYTLAKLASLHTGIDKYFTKDMKEVKKGCKKEATAEVRSLAKQLHEGLVELSSIREQLLDASGNI
ncbi:uncharacterized protein si:cabz01007807.1 isoform X2 [Ctenopharyngodon idella]|uniref:uncharacterized protein si:cabz01007807.1 isoform X2 n=1 Tax=Ctenopharyngodon idella TaxID=7959 RepID=UPI00222E9374|nr:uncharacterized protein si:cabz01007807.1 isoform X2 [Ctenopharyngodon idella]